MEKKSKILHIIQNKSFYRTLKAVAPELGLGKTNDVAYFTSCFNEGFIPKNFSKKEIKRYVSNTPYFDKWHASRFFSKLSKIKEKNYDEIVVWDDNSSNSIMLLCWLCYMFGNYKISTVSVSRRGCMTEFSGYEEAFENRVPLNEVDRQSLASHYDKEEWNKNKLWILKEGKIIEYKNSELRNYILSNCKTDTFLAAARVVGGCFGYIDDPANLFSLEVYYYEIVDMVREGILDTKQIVSDEKIEEYVKDWDVDEHLFAPNGVDISLMRLYAVRKKEKLSHDDLILLVAHAFKKGRFEYLEPYLSDDFFFRSEDILIDARNKEQSIRYLLGYLDGERSTDMIKEISPNTGKTWLRFSDNPRSSHVGIIEEDGKIKFMAICSSICD